MKSVALRKHFRSLWKVLFFFTFILSLKSRIILLQSWKCNSYYVYLTNAAKLDVWVSY